jgi:hypothetical protein
MLQAKVARAFQPVDWQHLIFGKHHGLECPCHFKPARGSRIRGLSGKPMPIEDRCAEKQVDDGVRRAPFSTFWQSSARAR